MSSRQPVSKLVIRADVNGHIGTGHVMRCIALGQAWIDAIQGTGDGSQGLVVFICAEIPDALADRIKSEGFDLIRIDVESGSPDDLSQTLNAVQSAIGNRQSSITNPWLVLDGYHFNIDYQRGVRASGYKLLLIDDYNHLPEYEADILVNQNVGAEEIVYCCNPDCRKLLGTKYVMLRREFRNVDAVSSPRFPEIGIKILVTLGGADPDNVTRNVIEALQQLDIPDLHAKIIVGPANPHLATLQQAVSASTHLPCEAAGKARVNYELINSVRDMPGLMRWADLAVSAAGSTCWELLAMKIPFISVILADNQVNISRQLEALAGMPSAGWGNVEFSSRLREIFQNRHHLFSTYSGRALLNIDGDGVRRILREVQAGGGIS